MTVLILGTRASGKSALAEDLALRIGDRYRIYLATMEICDDDSVKRVQRHRRMRRTKGFVTEEISMDIDTLVGKIPEPSHTTVLLECMPNLLGNEMHHHAYDPESLIERVYSETVTLADSVRNMIIVTDEYEVEESFDEETRLYVQLLSRVNKRLISYADQIYDLRRGRLFEDI